MSGLNDKIKPKAELLLIYSNLLIAIIQILIPKNVVIVPEQLLIGAGIVAVYILIFKNIKVD
jgi:hypothetical protein